MFFFYGVFKDVEYFGKIIVDDNKRSIDFFDGNFKLKRKVKKYYFKGLCGFFKRCVVDMGCFFGMRKKIV